MFVTLVAVTSESGEDVAKAYVASGYRCKSTEVARVAGLRLLSKVTVHQRLSEVRNMKPITGSLVETKTIQILEKVEVDKAWVTANLKAVVDRCMQAEAVLDRMGNPTGEFTFNAAGANRALELLGKKLGMFVDRVEARVAPQTVDEAIALMPPEVQRAEYERLLANAAAEEAAAKKRLN